MKNEKTRTLCECAIMVALATVLSLVKIYAAPLGGSVTLFSMVPIIILAMRHGTVWGLASGFVYSAVQLLLDIGTVAYVPTPGGVALCILFDYILPFTLLGLAGLFRNIDFAKSTADEKKKLYKNKLVATVLGSLLVCVLRFGCHLLSGGVVWYAITKAGEWNDYVSTVGCWTYSAVYNATYMVPETIITVVAAPLVVALLLALSKKSPAKK